MGLSQTDTKTWVLLLVSILIVSHSAFAEPKLNANHVSTEITQRLELLYRAKNRQFPHTLTDKSKQELEVPKDIQLPKNIQKDSIQMGGVSDGGGNAVGETLFDFYENQDSLVITVNELISIEPLTRQILEYLNAQVPAVDRSDRGGFGSLIVESLANKKIFLETKNISSSACLNQSMVTAPGQAVVACQSDSELRLNVHWLKSTNATNRAGLIIHELILSWARQKEVISDKGELEKGVRETVRTIFSTYPENNNLAEILNRIFYAEAFTPQEIEIVKEMPKNLYKIAKGFCETLGQDSMASELSEYIRNNSVLGNEIPSDFTNFIVALSPNPFGDSRPVAKERFCEPFKFDSLPKRLPKMESIPNSCHRQLFSATEEVVRKKKTILLQSKHTTADWNLRDIIYTVKLAAMNCANITEKEVDKRAFISKEKRYKLKDETYIESIIFIRNQLKDSGLSPSLFLYGE